MASGGKPAKKAAPDIAHDLVVVVPSRGRPDAAAELAAAFGSTCTGHAGVLFAVDHDDPALPDYQDTGAPVVVVGASPSTMVTALNGAAEIAAGAFAVGFMGDDHRPRTVGWDQAYLDALREMGTGIVYGNDLLQGANLPTQVAMTSDIVNALGYMAPPELVHLYVDNFWRDLGQHVGCLRYLPNVVVEHMHPIAGKADWDDGHRRVNASSMYAADRETYRRYQVERFSADVEKVRALR